MPLYEYQCESCSERFELLQKFSDSPADTCARCGKGPVHRLVSSPAIQFKGSGWYVTDYARKGGAGSEKTAPGTSKGASDTGAKAESRSTSDSAGSSSASSAPAATGTDKR